MQKYDSWNFQKLLFKFDAWVDETLNYLKSVSCLWVGDVVRATIYRTIRAPKYDTISCPLGTKIVRQIIFEEQNIKEKISKSSAAKEINLT